MSEQFYRRISIEDIVLTTSWPILTIRNLKVFIKTATVHRAIRRSDMVQLHGCCRERLRNLRPLASFVVAQLIDAKPSVDLPEAALRALRALRLAQIRPWIRRSPRSRWERALCHEPAEQ